MYSQFYIPMYIDARYEDNHLFKSFKKCESPMYLSTKHDLTLQKYFFKVIKKI